MDGAVGGHVRRLPATEHVAARQPSLPRYAATTAGDLQRVIDAPHSLSQGPCRTSW
ncbi:hypothetical protein [Kitasatospora sp. NPDC058218]|uniref:hypothetical protein n=1 Tax=Kitasatospora sp. NPDC058218 TaxID=3346385 RepID=UPI0036DEB4D3